MEKYKSENFINRELSWIEFNSRVLEEAEDKSNPLFERLKFCSIVSSNLDEFFMIRVASIVEQVNASFTMAYIAGYTPLKQLYMIREKVHSMIYEQYLCFKDLMEELNKQELILVKAEELNDRQKKYISNYYYDTIFPIITPIVVVKAGHFHLYLIKVLI